MNEKYTFNGEDFVICKFQGHLFWGRYNDSKRYLNLYQFKDKSKEPKVFVNWIESNNKYLEIVH